MKKRIPLLLLILLIPFIVQAQTCDENDIKISTIEKGTNTGAVEEIQEPVINGRKIKLDLKMKNVGDSIEYKLFIKNDSNEDYSLDENSLLEASDYIEYSLDMDNDEKIIKAHEGKDVYLSVTYKKAVNDSDFVNGVYQDNKSLVVNLKNNEETTNNTNNINNPSTGINFILLGCVLLVFIGSSYIIIKNNKKEYMIFLIGLLVIPFGVKALCNISLNVDSNVEIRKEEEFCISSQYSSEVTRHTYEAGMTWIDYAMSYHNDLDYKMTINENYVSLGTNACSGYLINNLSEAVKPFEQIEPCSVASYGTYIPPC